MGSLRSFERAREIHALTLFRLVPYSLAISVVS